MDIGIFLKSANDVYFEQALIYFAEGLKQHGDNPKIIDKETYQDCDISIFFGSWKNSNYLHHKLKSEIVKKCNKFVCLETPLIGRREVKPIFDDDSFRVGVNGFLNNSGIFYKGECPSDRWDLISKKFSLKLDDWNTPDPNAPVLVALQLPHDASLRGCNIIEWAFNVSKKIRSVSKRKIVIRTPQLEKKYEKKWIDELMNIENIFFQTGTKKNLIPTLKSCHCTITYTSGLSVDSLINGCPTIACNDGNFCYEVSQNDPLEVENINYFDRSQWINNLSYCQWDLLEIKNGKCWDHIKKII